MIFRFFSQFCQSARVVGFVILVFVGCKKSAPTLPREPHGQPPNITTAPVTSDVIELLTKSGFTRKAASAVISLNASYLSDLSQYAPEEFDRQISAWQRLSDRVELMQLLERRPEVAGLLAGATDPGLVARTLRDDVNYRTVTGLYVGYVGADADQLARALQRHSNLICHLVNQGLTGSESVFIFPRESPAIQVYDQWLENEFTSRQGDQEREIEFFQFLIFQGKTIRKLLLEDSDFAGKFVKEIWPSYEDAINSDWLSAGLSTLDADILKVLAMDDGVQLVKKLGNVATTFFFGPESFDPAVHQSVASVLLKGDHSTVTALYKLRREPLMIQLLKRRDITVETMTSAVTKAGANLNDGPRKLRQFAGFSGKTLADDVGPPTTGLVTWLPLYDTWQVAKKLRQGRDLDTFEAIFGVADPVFMVFGPLNPTKALAIVGKKSAKELGKESVEQAVKRGIKEAGRSVAKEIGQELTEQTARKKIPWMAQRFIKENAAELAKKLKSKMTVEITGPVQAMFKLSGVGLKTFKKFSKLDARNFMRSDRRVVIRLDRILKRAGITVIGDVSLNATVESFAESASGQKLLCLIVSKAMQARELVEQTVDSGTDNRKIWQRNVATWWNLTSSELPDRLSEALEKNEDSK